MSRLRGNEVFAAFASTEAIRVYLDRARAEMDRLAGEVTWLEILAAKRAAEEAAGTWPPRQPGQVDQR